MAEGDGTGLVAAAQAALLDDPAFLRGLVQGAVQAILEAEMDAHLGAGRYERGEERTGIATAPSRARSRRGWGRWSCGCRRTGRGRSRPSCSPATSAPSRRWW